VQLIGIRKVLLAVNKMDLVGYSEKVFRGIVEQYSTSRGRSVWTT